MISLVADMTKVAEFHDGGIYVDTWVVVAIIALLILGAVT